MLQKKLPGCPILVIVPNGPTDTNPDVSKRTKSWNVQMSSMGRVVPVIVPWLFDGKHESTVSSYKQRLYSAVHATVTEVL